MERELEVSRITIVRTLDANGRDIIGTECSDDLTLLDTLGMLAFAQAAIISDFDLQGEDDEEEDGPDNS